MYIKYVFLRKLVAILLVLFVNSLGFAQLVNSFTSESPAVTCQPNGAETVVTITNSGTALTNAKITIQLGVGIQIVSSSVLSVSGPTVSVSATNLNAPIFTVASWPANTTLKFSFRKKANCAARAQKIGGGGFQDVISIKNSSGTTLTILGTTTVTYDIIYASLSITNQSTTPTSLNPGQTATRSMRINNGSFGELEEFLFADISSAGKFIYSDFRLNPATTNIAVPTSAISTVGDSVKVKFDRNLIKSIGDGDETFELNENFVLQYKITVNPCCPAGTVTSKLITQWGCEGQICQTATDNTSSVGVTSTQPNLVFSTLTSSPRCFDTPAKQTIVIANPTSYAATNVKVQFGPVTSTPSFNSTQQLYLAGPYNYRIKNSGTPTSITPSTLATSTNACAPSGAPSQMETTIPVIAAGDTAYLEFYTVSCCVATCNASFTPRRWGYAATYSGACPTTTYSRTIQTGQNESYSANTFSLDAPLQVYDGQVFTMEVLSNSSSIAALYNTAPAYLEYKYTIPAGFIFSGNAADFSFIDAGGTTRTPNYFNYTGGVLTVRYNAPISFSQTRSRTLLKLTAQCGTAGNKTLNFQSQFVTDPSCSTSCAALPPQCSSIIVEQICPGGTCTQGLNWATYDIRRVTVGLPDNDNNSIPDPSGVFDPNLAKINRFIVGDTLQALYTGVVKTSVALPSFAFGYATASITNADEIADARYSIKIKRGTTTYTCNNLTATVTGTTTKVFTYDFSTSTLISKSCLPTGFVFSNGDSVIVTAKYIANNLTPNSTVEEILDVTPEFYVSTIVNPTTSAQKYQCGTRKGQVRHFDIFNNTTTSNTNLNGCGSFQLINNMNLSVGTSTGTTAGANVFTNEYRIFQVPATTKTLVPPSLYTINSVQVLLTRSVGFSTSTSGTSITVPNSYYYYSGDTLIVNLEQLFINGLLPYPEEGYSFRETITLTPIGAAGFVNSTSNIQTFTQYRNLSPLSAIAGKYLNGTNLSSVVSYNAPRLQLSSSQPTVNATSSTVTWDVVLSNISTLADAPFPWLTVKSKNGTFTLTQIQDITSTTTNITPTAGGIYQGSTTINKNSNRKYRITGTTNFCGRDTVEVYAGWSCSGLSNATTLQTVPYISDILPLYYEVKPSQISATITKVAGTFGMCSPFDVEIRIVSGQPASVNTILANLELPTNSGKVGLDYIAASGTIEYPKGTTPRAFTTAGNNLVIAAQSVGNTTLPFDLGVIDPTNFGTGKSLAGVGSAPNNEAVIRFKLQPNCDLLSGQPFGLRIYGNDPCGNKALGNAEYVQGFSVNITGANSPYNTQVSLNLPTVNACANVNYPIGVNVLNLGLASTNDSGVVEVQLPVGYLPVAGSVTCSSAFCPPNLNAFSTVSLPNGGKSLIWKVAAGMPIGGQMNFTFQVQLTSNLSCTTERITAQTSLPFDVFCKGVLCPNFRVLTGIVSDTLPVKKAVFSYISHNIAFTCSSATAEFKFKNTGAPVVTGNTTSVELYKDTDKSGTFTTGDVLIRTYSTTQAIATNETVTLGGTLPYSEPIPCPLVMVIRGCQCTTFQRNLAGNIQYENAGNDGITCGNQPTQLGCSAGISGYTYEWTPVGAALLSELSNPAIANPTVTVVNNGTTPIIRKYLLATTHTGGCITTDEVQITINPTPLVFPATLEKCNEGSGKATFTLANATPLVIGSQSNVQVTYFATRVNATNNVSPLGATFTAANGDSVFVRANRTNESCVSIGKVTFAVNPLPTLSVVPTNAKCFGAATGSIDLTVTGGTPNYSFLWSNAAITEDIANLTAGNYSVTVTDAKGCKATTNATVGQPTQLTATITKTNSSCNGANNGSLTAQASGGTAGYTYLWSNAATSATISNLPTGIYSVEITDANGCKTTAKDTITQPIPLAITATPTNIKCNGAATGGIALNVSGGTPTYTYSWNDGVTTKDRTGLTAGTYTVVVTDKNGCQKSLATTLTQPSAMTSSIVKTNVKCFDQNNGALDLSVSGGVSPYTYAWNSGQTTQNLLNLKAGFYQVTITDANGCTKTDTATVAQPASFFLFGTQTNVKCFGETNGTVTIQTLTGGTQPYSYSWSNGATTRNLTNLAAGEYILTVTDAQGCTVKGSNQIRQPDALKIDVTTQDVTCANGTSGALMAVVTGGTKPYRYEWRNTANNTVVSIAANATGLPVGNYALTVKDSNDCEKQKTNIVINQPPIISAQFVATDLTCFEANNGKIVVTANGGTGNLTYTWSDNGTGNNRTGLSIGTYSVVIEDANGCKITVSDIAITQPPKLTASAIATPTSCYKATDGRIDLSVIGGTTAYSFGWSNGSSIEDPQNLAAGNYSVTITDAKGCITTASAIVSQPDSLVLSINKQSVKCVGGNTGSIDLAVTGGTPTYTYSWNDGVTTKDRTGLTAGTYTVVVTDKNGCQKSLATTLTQPLAMTSSITKTNVKCFDQNNGALDLSVSGGVSPYTYAWNSGQTTQDLLNLKAGFYQVTITDANGCTKTDTATVTQPASFFLFGTQTNVKCFGETNGSITIQTLTGGTQPYSYSWSNGATTRNLTNLAAGEYTLTITDGQGCTVKGSNQIHQPDTLKIAVTSQDVTCPNGTSGTLVVEVTGGSKPYRYEWRNTANNNVVSTAANATGLPVGNYALTVKDSNDCEKQQTNIVINQPPTISAQFVATDLSCFEANDGKISITANGGTGNLTYTWSDNGTGNNRTALAVGVYGVVIEDANGCKITLSDIAITQPQKLTASAIATPASCYKMNDGRIDLSVTGGTKDYSFGWSNGSSIEDPQNLAAGNYAVTITDAKGCITTTSTIVSQPDSLVLHFNKQLVKCAGGNTGSIDLSVTGGTPTFGYLWSNGATAQNLTALTANTYTVVVTDQKGCKINGQVVVSQPDSLKATAKATDVKCFGGNDGKIDLTVTGGAGAYSYAWSNNATTQNLTNLKAGIYTVTIKDTNQCQIQLTAEIKQPDSLSATFTKTDVTCFGETNGSITLQTLTGGTQPYSYSWSNGATTRDLTNLTAGEYTITVTDGQGCTVKGSNQIHQPDALKIAVTTQDVTCPSGTSGTLVVEVTGGTKPYRYEWRNTANNNVVSTAANATALPVGNYTLTVKDSNNCEKQQTNIVINQPPTLSAQFVATDLTCFEAKDGKISITANGGTGNLTYTWSDNGTGNNRTGLAVGVYGVVIEDANGCKITLSNIAITQPAKLEASTIATPASCYKMNDGRIDLTVTGGTKAYSFGWSNGSSTEDPQNLAAGTYTVTITDAKGCITTDSTTVLQPDSLVLRFNKQSVKCAGGNTGSIDLSITGGTPTFSYLWSNGAISQNLTALTANTYTVVVTDQKGCKINGQVVISQPDSLKATAEITDVKCFGQNNGAIDLTVTGGSGIYSYAWSNNAITQNLSNLAAGIYTVTIKDTNQCQIQLTAQIKQPDSLAATFTKTDASCFGQNDGHITLTVSGGKKPYKYAWSNGATTPDLTKLVAGMYSVTITDSNNCQKQLSISIAQSDTLHIASVLTQIQCYGGNLGKIDLTLSGGTQPYTYAWSHGPTTEDVINLKAGTYSVTVTDKQGCKQATLFKINQPDSLIISASVENVLCKSGTNGKIDISVSGGISPYQYLWSTGATTQSLSGLSAGTYLINIKDNNGCDAALRVVLTEPDSLRISARFDPIICKGKTTDINITVNGGKSPYRYLWSNGQETKDFVGALAGNYSLTVTDSNSCTKTINVVLTEPDSLKLSFTQQNIKCKDGNTGSIDLTVVGGTQPYDYVWSNGGNTQDLSELKAGIYRVKVRDANGCTDSLQVVIAQPEALEITPTASNVKCKGDNSGTVSVSVKGGTVPYVYAWSNGATSANLTNLVGGVYSVKVTDQKGCMADLRVVIGEPDSLTLSLNPEDVDCNGLSSGTILSVVSGGSKPYRYAWSNGSTLPNVYGLPTGKYTLTVMDSNNCVISASTTLGEPAQLAPNAEIVHVSCFGGNNGSIDFNVAGGTGSYTYKWSNGATTQDITNLKAGVYSVVVKDGNKCMVEASFTIKQPNNRLKLTFAPTPISCHNGTNGSIALTIEGGTTPYKVKWSNNRTTQDIAGLSAGTYIVTVEDKNGCTTTDSVTFANPAQLSLIVKGGSFCEGDTVRLSATFDPTANIGWTGPVSFASAQPNPLIANSKAYQAGKYIATVHKDGCTRSDTAAVIIKTRPILDIIFVACNTGSYVVRVSVSPNATFTADKGTLVNEGNNKYFIQGIPQNQIVTLTARNEVGCEVIKKVDATICNANLPNFCSNQPAGPNALLCEPTKTHQLPKPTNGQYWVSLATNPSSASVDTLGAVTGIEKNGAYRFVLFSPRDNCADTVTVTRQAAPRFGVVANSPTCAGDSVNKDGFVQLSGFGVNDTFGLTLGSQYNENSVQQTIPLDGIILKNLINPSADATYTIRIKSENSCYSDKQVVLKKVECKCVPLPCVPLQMKMKK